MSDVTRLLDALQQGEPKATEDLLPLVYDELRKLAARKMAHERPGRTSQPTALVHEVYLRLVSSHKPQLWDSRRHFFAAAAESMRRILVERARRSQALSTAANWNESMRTADGLQRWATMATETTFETCSGRLTEKPGGQVRLGMVTDRAYVGHHRRRPLAAPSRCGA